MTRSQSNLLFQLCTPREAKATSLSHVFRGDMRQIGVYAKGVRAGGRKERLFSRGKFLYRKQELFVVIG